MKNSTILAAGAALAGLLAAGCKDDGRVSVQGAVRFAGQPVRAGVVLFDPDGTKRNDGPQGVAYIADGRYDTSSKGSRLASRGPMVVRISGNGDPTPEYPDGVPLFAYQTTADLPQGEASIDFDVPASARMVLPKTPVAP